MNRNYYLYIGAGVLVIVGFLIFGGSKDKPQAQDNSQDPTSGVSAQQLYQQAMILNKDGELVKARTLYKKIFTEHPDFEQIEVIQRELEDVNLRIIFSNMPTEKTVIHEVKSGDTLGKLAKQHKTTIDLIKISNNLDSDVIRIGQRLRIWTGTFNIFVDKSQNILILKEGDEVVKVYDVSTGSDNSTPVGEFRVTTRLTDPVWFNRGVVVPPESPANVLGSRWLGFDIPGYGIHGTIEPDTIGQQVTAGCVRMRNEDVEQLYSIIPTGTEVVITN